MENIKAISEMCAGGYNYNTFAYFCLGNFKTIMKGVWGAKFLINLSLHCLFAIF